ncbi:hypothetical protein [Shimia sp. NS0008-38b]|uniref:hypothetical protein n=1 Tax=Shimia sp. NS0008-38b TaxID=3127653 RepID=UPI0033428ADA
MLTLLLFIAIIVAMTLWIAAALMAVGQRVGGRVGVLACAVLMAGLVLFVMLEMYAILACGEWQARGEPGPTCEAPDSFLVPVIARFVGPICLIGLAVLTVIRLRKTPTVNETVAS